MKPKTIALIIVFIVICFVVYADYQLTTPESLVAQKVARDGFKNYRVCQKNMGTLDCQSLKNCFKLCKQGFDIIGGWEDNCSNLYPTLIKVTCK